MRTSMMLESRNQGKISRAHCDDFALISEFFLSEDPNMHMQSQKDNKCRIKQIEFRKKPFFIIHDSKYFPCLWFVICFKSERFCCGDMF